MATVSLQNEPAPVTQDAPILTAFARYRSARATYDALPFSEVDGEAYTFDEMAALASMDAAEGDIIRIPATTPQGVEAKLWLALLHGQSSHADCRAAATGDLAHFQAKADALDWSVRLVVSAIASLRAMGTVA